MGFVTLFHISPKYDLKMDEKGKEEKKASKKTLRASPSASFTHAKTSFKSIVAPRPYLWCIFHHILPKSVYDFTVTHYFPIGSGVGSKRWWQVNLHLTHDDSLPVFLHSRWTKATTYKIASPTALTFKNFNQSDCGALPQYVGVGMDKDALQATHKAQCLETLTEIHIRVLSKLKGHCTVFWENIIIKNNVPSVSHKTGFIVWLLDYWGRENHCFHDRCFQFYLHVPPCGFIFIWPIPLLSSLLVWFSLIHR